MFSSFCVREIWIGRTSRASNLRSIVENCRKEKKQDDKIYHMILVSGHSLAQKKIHETIHFTFQSCKTVARGTEEIVVTPSEEEKEHIQEYIRMRSLSQGYGSGDEKPRIKLNSISSVDSMVSKTKISLSVTDKK